MYFVRHGQSEFNVQHDETGYDPNIPDAPLTPLGVKQAQKAAGLLIGKKVRDVICSPYSRALQTANIIASELGSTLHIDALAGERCLYSCDIGTSASTLTRNWPDFDFSNLRPQQWWPEPDESMAALHRRVDAFRHKWRSLSQSGSCVLVSHWYFLFALTGQDMANGEVYFQSGLL